MEAVLRWVGVLLLALLVAPEAALAQSPRIAGQVVDAETGAGIPGAHVFLSFTMIGTTTDLEGKYALDGIEPGSYTLVVSMIGYQTLRHTIDISDAASSDYSFSLQPAVYNLDNIDIVGQRDRSWQQHFETFNTLFLGTTTNAAQTTILNAEVLQFDTDAAGRLRAVAIEPLQIRNEALGYQLLFSLYDFEYDIHAEVLRYAGAPLFEPMEPASEEEAAQWARAREQTYLGSLTHLLQGLVRGDTYDEGFMLYTLPEKRPVGSNELVGPVEATEYFVPLVVEEVEVIYHRKPIRRSGRRRLFGGGVVEEKSRLAFLSREGRIQRDGYYFPQEMIIVSGEMGKRRISDVLPREFGVMEE